MNPPLTAPTAQQLVFVPGSFLPPPFRPSPSASRPRRRGLVGSRLPRAFPLRPAGDGPQHSDLTDAASGRVTGRADAVPGPADQWTACLARTIVSAPGRSAEPFHRERRTEPVGRDRGLSAFAAQLGTDFLQTMLRNRLLDGVPLRDLARGFAGSARVELILSPVAFAATLAAVDAPIVLAIVIAPLVWLLDNFSKDRAARYAAALELNRAYRGTVMLLSDVLEFEDEYTAQHSRSVVDLVNAVADELGIAPDDRQELEFAAMLHDVGKISIPKEILHKPSALTDREFEVIKHHTIEGQFMLDRVGGLLGRVGEIVRSCHERWDGRGYPDGLIGEEIPIAARVVFACDAYNAMTTDRPYRGAMARDAAIAELKANTGTQFDPRIIAALIKVVEHGQVVPLTTTDGVRAVLAGAPVPQSAGAAS